MSTPFEFILLFVRNLQEINQVSFGIRCCRQFCGTFPFVIHNEFDPMCPWWQVQYRGKVVCACEVGQVRNKSSKRKEAGDGYVSLSSPVYSGLSRRLFVGPATSNPEPCSNINPLPFV